MYETIKGEKGWSRRGEFVDFCYCLEGIGLQLAIKSSVL